MNAYAYNNNAYHNSYAQVPGFNEGFKVHHRHRCVPQDHRLHLQPRTRRELCAHVSGTAGRRVVLFKTWYVVGCAVRRLLTCYHLALSSRTSCDLPSLPHPTRSPSEQPHQSKMKIGFGSTGASGDLVAEIGFGVKSSPMPRSCFGAPDSTLGWPQPVKAGDTVCIVMKWLGDKLAKEYDLGEMTAGPAGEGT